MAKQKGINAHSNQRIVTVEDNLNKKLDGLKNDFDHKWDNRKDSIEKIHRSAAMSTRGRVPK